MITKTIGVGGDLPDIGTAYQYAMSQSPYVWPSYHFTDDWQFTIVSDFTEVVGASNFSPNVYGLLDLSPFFEKHTLSILNPNGYTTDCNSAIGHAGYTFLDRGSNIESTLIIDGLIFELPIFSSNFVWLKFLSGNQGTSAVSAYYKNIKFIGKGSAGALTTAMLAFEGDFLRPCSMHIVNCLFYNLPVGIGGVARVVGLENIIENCSAYSCRYGTNHSITNGEIDFKNMVCFNSSVFDFVSSSGVNITNCADSDNSISTCGATLSNNITGITTADFLSVDPTSADFLKIDRTSSLYGVGSLDISSWNTEDIDGNPRPNGYGKVSIGAYEPLAEPTHQTISRALRILLSDYKTSIALLGEIHGSNQPAVFILRNGLTDGPLEIAMMDGGEAVIKLQMTAHYTPGDLDAEPWEIRCVKETTTEEPVTGLTSHWKFEDNLNDDISGHTLLFDLSPAYPGDPREEVYIESGAINKAIDLQYVDGYGIYWDVLQIPDHPDFYFSASDRFEIEYYFKELEELAYIDGVNDSAISMYFSGFILTMWRDETTGGNLTFTFLDLSTYNYQEYILEQTQFLSWKKIKYTFDNTVLELYIDDIKQTPDSGYSSLSLSNSGAITITITSYQFHVAIDELKIYNSF